MAIVFDLLDLVQVLLEGLTRMRCVVPPLGFVDNGRDCLVLNHCADVDRVVHASENTTLILVPHRHEIEQLQPERF